MQGRTRAWVIGLATVGLIAAASSTYMHFQLANDPFYTSFCDVNASVSCTQLYQGPYGSVGGIPVALGGVFWFGVVLLLTLAYVKSPAASRQNVALYLRVWSVIGLSVTGYMAYVSFFILGTFCILCGIVYVTVVGIFFLADSEVTAPLRTLPIAASRDLGFLVRRPAGLLLTLVFVGSLTGIALTFPQTQAGLNLPEPLGSVTENVPPAARPEPTEDQRSEFERFWTGQPRVELDIATGEAPVVVVKFNDFQCPACANTHFAYEPVFQKYASSHPGSVRLVMLDFPLDPACNDQTPNGQHGAACEAAVAARLAREVGEDEAALMQQWLYRNQQTMSADTIAVALAEVAGVGVDHLASRFDEVIPEVRADIAVGSELPVQATPTYIINGVVLRGGLTPQLFDQAISLELERNQ
ncbi:MAG: vitamin K epoxide reductase family protein [Acidobacteriota bacterium]|nr:vitamin K epoxide reductase family protein [Acidobacteriota bacterium]